MKKQLLCYAITFICINIFSQEIIENPKYSRIYKKNTLIKKIELNETETILHITSRNKEKNWITIPKTTYISDEDSNKKMFVLKSEGISLGSKTPLNDKNEISYKLFFPALQKTSNVIDLKIEKEAIGSWKGQPRNDITLAYRIEVRLPQENNIFNKLSLKKAFIKAKNENKKVLLFFTAPWCGPCNWMKKYIHTDREIIDLINKNYIAVEINRDTQKGAKSAKEYNNTGIPYYVVLTPKNELLKTQTGSRKKGDFIEFLTLKGTNIPIIVDKPKQKTTHIDPGYGLRLGIVRNIMNNGEFDHRNGFTADLFYSKEVNDLYLFRTGFGFNSKGVRNFSINYLRFPVEFGIKILNGSLIHTQGGIRAMVSPYYAFRLNKENKNLSSNDYGIRFGLSHFIGSDNELELELYYEYGMQDIIKDLNGKQNNKGLGLSLLLSL
ncbi:thioredoxin family protein [Snuella sedimenti]|uniref:Thioredoxin family protein n=1 Tax=Snuella sedimenti TaxID=2798802 RepID=A0A8J7IHS5_9FLAO|nr:thioredoxin family protein [Snuella sedimenti]MBJ6368763.1 thioredoxin family protein [Snuella sedimenti]